MSLILDALRKSEAERRRGQSPDLFAATPGAPSAAPPRPRVWPLLLLGAMLLASAWMIWSAGDTAPPAPSPTAADTGGVEVRDAAPHANAAPPAAPATPAPRTSAATRPAAPIATRAPAPAASTLPPAPAFADPAMLPAPPPAPPEATPPADPELPPLAVLDAATRASLPPLKLSMHVYAYEPARRFAIIDGQRVAEGARVGSGVVARIRRDGVVIEVDGRQVLLPKP